MSDGLDELLGYPTDYNAINKNRKAWIYLLIDVIIGLISFLGYHYMEGNFSKVF